MVCLPTSKWRIVSPSDADYADYAEEYGVRRQHVAVKLSDTRITKVLPLAYVTLSANGVKRIVRVSRRKIK